MGVVVLGVAYAVTLAVGFLSLKSSQQPIGDPMFSILEVLIIVMMPVMVALMVAVNAWAPSPAKTLSPTTRKHLITDLESLELQSECKAYCAFTMTALLRGAREPVSALQPIRL